MISNFDLSCKFTIYPIEISKIDLQWFAAEDEGRTEEPSETKIRKSREDGKVAKSQDFISALGILLPAIAIVLLAPYLYGTFKAMLIFFITRIGQNGYTVSGSILAIASLNYFIKLVLPIILVAVIAAIVSNLVQVGFLFSAKGIIPDFTKIVPRLGQYFKRTIVSLDGVYNLARSLIKIVVIFAITWVILSGEFKKLLILFNTDLYKGLNYIFVLVMRLIITSAVVLLFLSIPDYLFQRRQFREGLKMSKQEVKEERKQQEGDPLVKSRVRQRMRELLSKNMILNVPKADVVITNPTHYAVALEYDRDKMLAPILTAKGQDSLALRIKTIAKDASVPIIENKPLARALYSEVEIGDSVPIKYYELIAAVLSNAYKISGKDFYNSLNNTYIKEDYNYYKTKEGVYDKS